MSTVRSVDVASYILQRGSRTGHDLQKLVYYAQAWSLTWNGKPMFADPVQAWPKGPVAPRLFREHRTQKTVHRVEGNPEVLTDEQRAVIDAVLAHYGQLGPAALVEMTHNDQPWIDARGDLPADASSKEVITNRSMLRFYTGQELIGADTPVKPTSQVVEAGRSTALQVADEQRAKWRSTLDWLAVR